MATPAAWAAESIPSYAVQLQVRPDGTLHVREEVAYDFGGAQRHGIEREIPVRYRYDDTFDRVLRIENVRVVSPTGAPADVSENEEGAYLTLRIGDPDETVT